MISSPPSGSNITVSSDGNDPIITIPYPSGGLAQYGGALFLFCWLGGWAFGWVQAGKMLLSDKANLFVLFWLGAWTLGGAAAIYSLYRLLRPTVPATLRLAPSGLSYDSGNPPMRWSAFSANQQQSWREYFPRRVRVTLARQELQSLQLRETTLGNRLTVDSGAERIDLARGASEIEREWLYRVLVERYDLAAAPSA